MGIKIHVFMRKNKKSLYETHPHIMKIWDFEKNIIDPKTVCAGSTERVFWKCLKDKTHNYSLTIVAKTKFESQCPQCTGRAVSDKNRLTIINPNIYNEWDYTKNLLKPEDYCHSSNKKVWLKCLKNKQHGSYFVSLNHKATRGSGCPLCANNKSDKNLLILINDRCEYDPQRSWIHSKIKSIRNLAKQKHEWQLSNLECAQLILAPCYYCNRYFHKKMGIDRKNNNLGYIIKNCVSCCRFCNTAKLNKNIDDFKSWIIMAFLNKKMPLPTIYRKPLINIFCEMRCHAKTRQISFNLTKNDIANILLQNCNYCGTDLLLGIDRINSNDHYHINNIISCCKDCNLAKLTQTELEFREMIINLYTNIDNF